MQPLGRKPKTHNFTDCHPAKGLVNWWEPSATENKRGDRHMSKMEIRKEIDDVDFLDGHDPVIEGYGEGVSTDES